MRRHNRRRNGRKQSFPHIDYALVKSAFEDRDPRRVWGIGYNSQTATCDCSSNNGHFELIAEAWNQRGQVGEGGIVGEVSLWVFVLPTQINGQKIRCN